MPLFPKEAIVLAMRLGRVGRRRGRTATLVVLVLLHPAAAAAQTSLTTNIETALRSECPTPLAVQIRLDAYLEASEQPAPLDATIHVTATPAQGYAAQVELRRGELRSTRTAEGVSCADVLEAATLVIAIAADPDVAMRGAPEDASALEVAASPDEPAGDGLADPRDADPGDAPERDEVALETPEPLEAAPDEASPAETDEPGRADAPASEPSGGLALEPWAAWFTARVGPSLSTGVLPEAAFGVAAEVGLRFGLFEAALGFQWHSETERITAADRGGRFSAYEGIARVGIALRVDAFELAPSARLGVAAMTGRGFGVASVFTGVTPWVGLGGGLELRFRFDVEPGADVAIVAGGDLLAGLTRPAFVLRGAETVYVPSELAASFTAGLRGFFGGSEIE